MSVLKTEVSQGTASSNLALSVSCASIKVTIILNMNLDYYKKGLSENFIINDIKVLQNRYIVTGIYQGKPSFGKFFSKADAEKDKVLKEHIEWGFNSLVNSTKFHKLLNKLENEIKLDLGVAKLFDDFSDSTKAYQIMEFIDGPALSASHISISGQLI